MYIYKYTSPHIYYTYIEKMKKKPIGNKRQRNKRNNVTFYLYF